MRIWIVSIVAAAFSLGVAPVGAADDSDTAQPVRLQQLKAAASIIRDTHHIAHIRARNEHDVFFLQGWVHAEDRLFQMDYERRIANGTVAELLGSQALESDVTLRTLGLGRAAQQSLPVLLPDTRAALQAYADGVNAWIASHALPPEYGALDLTKVAPWTAPDSLAIGKLLAFSLAFTLDIDATVQYVSYVQAGRALGFDGDKLYREDLERSAPFDRASTVPDASTPRAAANDRTGPQALGADTSWIHPKALEQARAYLQRAHRIPVLRGIMERNHRAGSNLWAVSGALTDTGRPLIANDPHLDLITPSQLYPIGLEVPDGLTVSGESLAGVPGVLLGYNKHVSWGLTNLTIDATDTYQEQVVPVPLAVSPTSGLATVYKGMLEPVIAIAETFNVNRLDGVLDHIVAVSGGSIPAYTLIVPRRNNGPIISLDPATGIALSVQYTGSGATRELDAVLKFNHASNRAEFVDAVQYFVVGAQNVVYADDEGDIAYLTMGELPIREDLQANTVNGSPPWFIRNGQGGNEWLPVQHPQLHQTLPFEILPFSEMPRIVNPPAEFFVNANNDPAGVTLDNNPLGRQRAAGGIYYLAYSFNPGFRAGRIKERIEQYLESGDGLLSFARMQSIQADVQLRDAQVFVPYVLDAFRNAQREEAPSKLVALTSNARLAEAVQRLAKWSFSTRTGIPEGYDASEVRSPGSPPTQAQIDDSVAATIYAVWRSEFVKRVIDAQLTPFGLPVPDDFASLVALRNLLDHFAQNRGVGASGVNFFNVAGLGAEDARDFVLLSSLAGALDALASDAFDSVFHKSTTLGDYRWGKLHRLVLAHPLDGPFSIPPAGGAFPAPLAGLAGIPVDGAFQTVNAASHSVRAEGADEFMFTTGPARRFVSEPSWREPFSESIWPGGTSGVLGSPWYLNFLPLWLTKEAIPLLLDHAEVQRQAAEVIRFVPAQ